MEQDRSAATIHRHPAGGGAPHALAAAAMIAFEMSLTGLFGDLELRSIDERMAGEIALVKSVQRTLVELDKADGRLVTAGGTNDLSLIRIGALRHRDFSPGGAEVWLRDPRDAHDDVLELMDPAGVAGGETDQFLAALCGRGPSARAIVRPRRRERIAAEFQAVRTMTAYLFLMSERHQSVEPLATGVAALADMIWAMADSAPHLVPILECELFKIFGPVPF